MPKPPADDSLSLMRFIADEVRDRYYADLLIERAEAARQGKPAPNASGDSYNVTFGPAEIIIEHRYREEWRPLHVARKEFVAALQRWRSRT